MNLLNPSGKPYLISAENYKEADVSKSRSNWYCSLLCYAAYKAQKIELDDKCSAGVLYPRSLIKSNKLTLRDIGN